MSKTTSKPIILIDGSSYFHRAFHALPPLLTSRGEPTGAIYGVINMIRKLINDYDPELIAVVFDAKGKTFRHELYNEYKATRPTMPDDLRSQVKPLHEVIHAMGLPLLIVEGVEADDVIGTLATQASKEKIPVVISTGDKDMAQLVNEHITLINTMSNTALDIDGVLTKFGIPPEKIIDYLALIGDTSDNIPGIPMVGPKTAVKLLNDYGSIDEIIKHADEVKGKVGENLRANINQLPISRELATIKKDVKLDVAPHDLKRTAPDNSKLIELFQHLEFKTWLAPLLNSEKPTTSKKSAPNEYQIIFHADDFTSFLQKLHKAHSFAFDLETTSLDPFSAKLVGIAFAINIGEAIYIPLGHDYLGAPSQLQLEYVLEHLKPFLEDKKIIKLGQNLKYNINVLTNYGIATQGIGFDIMLESYVLSSTESQHSKEALALKYLHKNITTLEDVAGKGAKQITFNQVNIEKAASYASSGSDLVLQLHEVMWKELEGIPSLAKVLQQIEMPLLEVLARMERTGVLIDVNLLVQQSKHLEKKLQHLENEVYKMAGQEFNLNSPLQLQEILFTKLKLPVLQKTPTGQPSTGEQVLQELALDYPLPSLILEYRGLSKLKSTYTDSLPKQVNPKSQRIHTSYNQAVTTTGRLSSTNPNLQNIPARTEEGRLIRKAFIAPPHHKIISADYSQIELRIMAHLSKDENLLKAFATDGDVHKATAAEVFGVPLSKVTHEQRQRSKMINFGLIYGMSAFGLAKRLGMDKAEAQQHVNTYFEKYPNVKIYMDAAKSIAKKLGYVETMFGRRLYIPDIKSTNFQRRAAAERTAINAPIQGSAADIIKLAMINIDHWIQNCKFDIKMIMQVHDELVFEVATDEAKEALKHIIHYMENAIKLHVPIVVNAGISDNWEEAH